VAGVAAAGRATESRPDSEDNVMTIQTTLTPRRQNRGNPLVSLFDHFFGDVFGDHLPETFTRQTLPRMNVAETDKALTLSFELPGLDEKDIKVEVLGDQLVVNAERKFEEKKEDTKFHRVEQQYGAFTRSVTLPRDLDPQGIDATYKKGILTITIP
jgi:HSP20 family protein